MKILLVEGRYFDKEHRTIWRCVIPPMGLANIAGVLRENGYKNVKILDMEPLEYTLKDFEDYLIKEKPDVVGIKIRTPLVKSRQKMAKIVKKVLPNCILVVGGPHAFILSEEMMDQFPEADYMLKGEVEYTFLELMDYIRDKKNIKEIKKIEGIGLREEGEIFISPLVPKIQNLDELPLPANDLLPIGKYFEPLTHSKKSFAMMTTRGCPYNCAFCSEPTIYGNKVRARSIEHVLEEIRDLVYNHNVDHIIFHDSTFNYDEKRVIEFCDAVIKEGLKFSWKVKARVNIVSKKMLEKMKQAGCQLLGFGVESGNQKTLDLLNKGITIQQIKYAFRLAHEAGLETMAYFMFGAPGETEQDMENSLKLAIELDPTYTHFMVVTPCPSTRLYKELKNKNIITDDWSKFWFYSGIVDYENLSHEEIQKFYKKAYIKFYFRPKFIWKHIKNLKSFGDFLFKSKQLLLFFPILVKKGAVGDVVHQ